MGGPERQCSDDDTATLRLKRELERKSEALVKAERAKTLLRRYDGLRNNHARSKAHFHDAALFIRV